jgi:hypothetical protein
VSALRRGAAALKADNAALRAEREHPRTRPTRRCARHGSRPAGRSPCGCRATRARPAPRGSSSHSVCATGSRPACSTAPVLLVSELVTNSVRHSGAGPEDAVIVRVGLSPRWFASKSRMPAAAA